MNHPTSPTLAPALATRFTAVLKSQLESAEHEAARIDPLQAEVLAAVRAELLRGGKRLRPTLCYLTHMGVGGTDNDALIQACASLELIHHYLLIHDDVFDRDLVRHGGPNVLGTFYDKFRPRLDHAEAMHYAGAYAVMAGNVVNVLARQTLLQTDYRAELKLAAADRIEHMMFEIMAGELLDVAVAVPGAAVASESQLLKIARYKTATYSFETPLAIGALLAGAADKTISSLTEFGRRLGIAYQLVDDLLGLYGDEATLGKPVGSDMREGKQTLLMHEAKARATAAQRGRLDQIWGSRTAGDAELAELRSLVEATGAREQLEQLAAGYQQEALVHLHAAGLAGPYTAQLEQLSAACIKRSS